MNFFKLTDKRTESDAYGAHHAKCTGGLKNFNAAILTYKYPPLSAGLGGVFSCDCSTRNGSYKHAYMSYTSTTLAPNKYRDKENF